MAHQPEIDEYLSQVKLVYPKLSDDALAFYTVATTIIYIVERNERKPN